MPEQSRGANLFGGPALDQAFCGIGAGTVSTLFMHPLDLLKVKFQVSPDRIRIVASLRDIIRSDGFRGLYRGLSPNIIGNAASWGFYFLWYTQLKAAIAGDDPTRRLSATEHLSAAAIAGVASAVVTNPLWVVKTRMFTSRAKDAHAYRNVVDGLIKIGREEGLKGLYRGTVLALVGVSNGAIQFMAYEELKNWRRDVARRTSGTSSSDDDIDLTNAEYILCSGAAKLCAIAVTYPYQVVRSRIQVGSTLPSMHSFTTDPRGHLLSLVSNQRVLRDGSTLVPSSAPSSDARQLVPYRSIPHCISHTFRTEGISAFYKGLAPNAVRVLPGTCVTFVVYENLSRMVKAAGERRSLRTEDG